METESDSTHILLLIAAIYLFIKVWPRIKGFVALWRTRLTGDRFVLTDSPPAHAVQVVLEAASMDLQTLGFTRAFSFDLISGETVLRYDYYPNLLEPGTNALVTAPLQPAQRPYDIHLQTRFQSEAGEEFLVETIGGRINLCDNETLPHAAYLGTIATGDLWREHQKRVQDYEESGNRQILEDKGKAYVDAANKSSEEEMRKRGEDGSYVRNRDGSYRFTAAAAFAALKNAGATGNSGTTTVLESAAPDEPAAMRLEAARCSLVRADQEKRAKPGYLILFAISLVASIVGLWIWGGWHTALFLTIVIFIHEMGHFAGMKLCGYRDARIFFVPMLGGVATGSKSNPTPVQELIVLLLGPVPGLFLGIIATVASSTMEAAPEWLYDFGIYAFIINYLNLLPVMPLDGGRIVNTLFMRSFPRLQFIFSIASILMLAAGGVLMGSILLGMFALFGLMRLRAEWFNGTIEKAVLPQLTSERPDPDETTQLVVQAMHGNPIPQSLRPLPTRIALVNQIVAALARTKASIAVMIIGSSIYFLSLVIPLGIYLLVFIAFSDSFDYADPVDIDLDESVIESPDEQSTGARRDQ